MFRRFPRHFRAFILWVHKIPARFPQNFPQMFPQKYFLKVTEELLQERRERISFVTVSVRMVQVCTPTCLWPSEGLLPSQSPKVSSLLWKPREPHCQGPSESANWQPDTLVSLTAPKLCARPVISHFPLSISISSAISI